MADVAPQIRQRPESDEQQLQASSQDVAAALVEKKQPASMPGEGPTAAELGHVVGGDLRDSTLKLDPSQNPPYSSFPICAQFRVNTEVEVNRKPLERMFGGKDDAANAAALEEHLRRVWRCPAVKACSALPADMVCAESTHTPLSSGNAFAQAVAYAFFNHYPLDLDPAVVWQAIMQGLAEHIKFNAEELRDKFVTHEGQKYLEVVDRSLRPDSPPAVWARNVPKYAALILENIKPGALPAACLSPSFSTMTFDARVALTITLMDMHKVYFSYGLRGGCALTAVTLRGCARDWQTIAEAVQHFAQFGDHARAWVSELSIVLNEFVSVTSGNAPAMDFWNSIVSVRYGSGEVVPWTGWISAFFPYVKLGDPALASNVKPAPLKAGLPTFPVHVQTMNGRRQTVTVTKHTRLIDICLETGMFGSFIANGKRLGGDMSVTLEACGVKEEATLAVNYGTVEMNVPSPALAAWRTKGAAGLNPSAFPSGISSVPVTFKLGPQGYELLEIPMDFKSGFIGVAQDPETLAVRPVIGWAMCVANA